jgi:2-dehydropantoate 2-reductase
MNFLVVGIGALGTVYATFIKAAGHSVFALTKEKYLDDFGNLRVKASGIWGEKEAVLDGIYGSVEQLRRIPLDVIILTVKSYDTEQAALQIKPLIQENTLVIVSQNGYGNYEKVSQTIGREHTLLARVIFGARFIRTGHAEVTVIADNVRLGQPHNAVREERIIEIAEAINRSGIPTSYARDVYQLLWDKILYNCALNPLGAVLQCRYGTLAEYEGTRRIMNGIISEIFAVTKVHGIALKWDTPESYQEHFYTRLVPPTRAHFPSMYYDLNAGKRLEIDALNGAIVLLAQEKNIPVPVNETITNLIKTKEAILSQEPSSQIHKFP